MPGSALKRDLLKDFDKRLKYLDFRAKRPRIKEWKKTSIANHVYDIETQQRFKSTEERLTYRMEVWIDLCRLETVIDGKITNGTGRFHSAKRFRKSESKLVKVRSFNLGRSSNSISTKSVDDIPTIQQNFPKDLPGPLKKKSQKRPRIMSPAFSTGDIFEQNMNSDKEVNDIANKYGTGPKRKFRFFLFRKSSNKDKSKIVEKKQNSQQEEKSDNNNYALSSSSQKLRPSLFDMESLRGSIPELAKLSIHSNVEQYEYDPSRSKQRGYQDDNKFNSLNGIPAQQETLFKAPHKDSFRNIKQKNRNSYTGQMFYDPQKKETELGSI